MIMVLGIQTNRSGQTIRPLLKKQSDQGLHCLPLGLLLDALLYGETTLNILGLIRLFIWLSKFSDFYGSKSSIYLLFC